MICANIFDFIDGKVAFITGKQSEFGAFWDSTLDRFSDLALFTGLIWLYSKLGRTDYVLITTLTLIFAIMTSYARARAECLIEKCKVGFMERPERIVLFMIGAFTNRMAAVLWVILVLSVLSVANRIHYTYLALNNKPMPSTAGLRGIVQPRLLLARRTDDDSLRFVGDCDTGVRLAHAARLAERSRRRRPARATAVDPVEDPGRSESCLDSRFPGDAARAQRAARDTAAARSPAWARPCCCPSRTISPLR